MYLKDPLSNVVIVVDDEKCIQIGLFFENI